MNTEEGMKKSEMALREEAVLSKWKKEGVFDMTLRKAAPKGEFVFYEGPPTANAAPALHHLEARAFKDIIPRYKTMQGYHVRRKAGWDTHGLPVELQVEKKLGLTSKPEIETYGVDRFNAECRASVWGHIDTWHNFTDRIGYWVDSVHPYVTYENRYMESVWNVVKTAHEQNLLYKDYRVVPWCPRCGTALSSHELAQGYADITDLSVYVKFKVTNPEKIGLSGNVFLVAWTTTPWTLPGNVGLAVGGDIEYVKAKVGDDILIVAEERLSVLSEYTVLSKMKGTDLVDLTYEPLYPYLKELITEDKKESLSRAYTVYPASFVTTTDGTGIVHTAVMYGQEDFELGTAVGLPKFHLVSTEGYFIAGTDFLEGKYVRDEATTVDIIKDLAHRGLLLKKEKYVHSYPHCWRCKTALIYYARDSWYIRMSSLRQELLAENEKINWEPAHIKEGRFGEWLREAKDWNISRERYWGTPLPVWQRPDGHFRVVGSVGEIKERVKKSGNTYYGMRHGEAEHNVAGVWSCKKDDPHHLTETGREQVGESVAKLTQEVEQFDYIFVSPFFRTTETAARVAEAYGLSPECIHSDDRLGEWNVGEEFDGKAMDEYFNTRRKSENGYTFTSPGGESYRDIVKRAGEFLYHLETTYQNKRILIISHGAVLRAFEMVARGVSMENEKEFRHSCNNFHFAETRRIDFAPLPHNNFYELDLHRPYIDEVTLLDDDGVELSRSKEVMDVWLDSGAMPFAQDHYPFENTAWVEGKGYPADFISEAIDQTRGWFYLLLCVGVLMKRGTSYKNVICLGHILDKDGKKMSKSVGNIVNPWEMMDTYGVDTLRLWMYSVNQPGDSKNFDEKTVADIVKKVWNPLINILSLFSMYEKDIPRVEARLSQNVLDQWVIARLDQLTGEMTQHLDSYKVLEPVRALRDFVQDLSLWYIRRSRERFKSDDITERGEVVSTTAYVLTEFAKLLAPFAPFFAEHMFGVVSQKQTSVHLEEWPSAKAYDETLLLSMRTVRDAVTTLLELRQNAGIKVRQPLATATITTPLPDTLLAIIADEVNVKVVSSGEDTTLDTELTDALRKEGFVRDLIRLVQDARKTEGLSPKDSITLTVCATPTYQSYITEYRSLLTTPTQATDILFVDTPQTYVYDGDDGQVSLSIARTA